MVLQGEDGINTRFVCGYNPCPSEKKATKSSYQQHRRYFIRKEKDRTCPRKRFRQDLIRQLVQLRKEGNRLVVCLDANGDIYKKKLGKDLVKTGELEMVEVVGNFTGQKVGPTFFRGKDPIDGVWATPDVVITGACVMPVGYGVGDHRMFVIDFFTSSLIGCNPPKIVRAAARTLNTMIPGVEAKYVNMLEALMEHHKIVHKVQRLLGDGLSEVELKRGLDALDVEMRQYMYAAEKKCRRVESGRIPFSPEASKWIRKAQVYRSLLRLLLD